MPEINPLTNNQIFLKKIAENTGSDYETGDVSEINPLTIDQILLKEIAANTAGQAGDITELEGKVADNTSAIEAIASQLGKAKIYLAGSSEATSVTFTGIKIIGSRYPALLIGNGNGTPFMAACALHSAQISDVAISDANLTIATSNITDTQYDLTIGGVNTWGHYALLVFYH